MSDYYSTTWAWAYGVSRIQVKEEEESHEALPNVCVEEQTGVGRGA